MEFCVMHTRFLLKAQWPLMLCVFLVLPLSAEGNPTGTSDEVQRFLEKYEEAWESRNPFQLIGLSPVGSRVFTPLLSSERFDQCKKTDIQLEDIQVEERDGGKRADVRFTKIQEDLFWVGTITRGRARIKMTLQKTDAGYQIIDHGIDEAASEGLFGDVYVSSNPMTWHKGIHPLEQKFYLAYQKIILGQFNEGKALLEELANFTPEKSGLDQIQYSLGTHIFRAQIHYFLGLCEKKLGNTSEWIARMKHAAEMHQSFPLALNEIAEYSAGKGELSGALKAWRLSLDLGPNQTGVAEQIDFHEGALLYPAGEQRDLYLQTRDLPPSQTLEVLGKLLSLAPNHVETRRRLAIAHLLDYDPGSAEKHLKITQFLVPGDVETEYLLGRVYMSQSRFEDAYKQFQIVWNEQPGYRDCLVYLSEISSMKRRYRQALSYLREALRLQPGDPVILYKLGVYSLKLGDRFEAMAYLRQSMEAGPPEHIRQDLYSQLMEL